MEAARERGRGDGGSRAAFLLAWSLAGLSVAMSVASVPLHVLLRSGHVPSNWEVNLTVGNLLGGVLFLIFPLVGPLIASRRPRNPIGWILLADGVLWMLTGLMDYYGVYGVASPGSVPLPVIVAGINNIMWVPAVGVLGTYVFLLFPVGRLPSRRWRPLAWLAGGVIVLLCILVGLSPGRLQNLGDVRNPFGLESYPWVETAGYFVLPLLPLCMIASVLSLVMRYRRSRGEERQQIKWIAYAAALLGIVVMVSLVGDLLFGGFGWWLFLVVIVAFLGLPLSIGVAVLRYRLYDIDVIINRTLVYGSLSVTLVLVYFGSVVGLQYILRALTGQESQVAIVVSTLVIAALFNPLRQRIQNLIDYSFYRRKYDAAKTLEAFSAKLRDETDMDTLNSELLSTVRETIQPEYVSLWMREPERGAKDDAARP